MLDVSGHVRTHVEAPAMGPTFRAAAFLGLTLTLLTPQIALPAETLIDRSVARAVAALRRLQSPDGQFGSHGSGSTALVALALLEGGVAPDDVCVQKAVAAVRADCPHLNRVYHLSLAIMLFDRLGDPRDVPLIQALTVRLLEGQFPEGGWSYTTPGADEAEAQRLKALIAGRAEFRTGPGDRPAGPPPLDPGLQDRLRRLQPAPGGGQARIENHQARPLTGFIDNSNTQFAVLALWVSRRHGLPAEESLHRAERYFRATHENGTWYYIRFFDTNTAQVPGWLANPNEPNGRAAMTCAGLLGLAVGGGLRREAQLKTAPGPAGEVGERPPPEYDPLRDPLVVAALRYVSDRLAEHAQQGVSGQPLNYYFLWSLERVGVAYDLKIIGGRNWHLIGSQLLLLHQKPDGTWENMYGPAVDTSFAVLFLKRANFARDLTAALQRKPPPGQSTLKAGGRPGESADPGGHEAERLRRELATSPPSRQAAILEQLRDGKGAEFTEALVGAVGDVMGAMQTKARDCLTARLARMTATTLRDRLRDDRAEMRRAAALACGMKDDKGMIPDLVAVLDDADAWVVRAAGAGLRALTGKNFGPSATADADERAKAVAAWKAWWKRQPKGR
jgi:hypothetical protein